MRDAQDHNTPDLIHGGMRIGYARVSTHDQNLDAQHDALQAAGCSRIYSDTISGATDRRPELDNALKALRTGDTLVVWRLDRLGRSMKHLVILITELEAQGVKLESLNESIDTSTSTGKLITHVFGMLAEFERNLISERTKAGLKAARARGRKGGRKPALTTKKVKEIETLLSDPNLDITVADAAKQYGVARSTIYNHIDVEKIKKNRLLMESLSNA